MKKGGKMALTLIHKNINISEMGQDMAMKFCKHLLSYTLSALIQEIQVQKTKILPRNVHSNSKITGGEPGTAFYNMRQPFFPS